MSSPYLPPTGSAPPPPLLAAIAALSASTSPSISMPPPPLPPSIYPYPLPPTNISTPTTDKAKKKAGISKGSGSRRVPSCSFCRKSHMSCDAARPCARCVKRGIAHLCRDDRELDSPREEKLSFGVGGAGNLLGLSDSVSPVPPPAATVAVVPKVKVPKKVRMENAIASGSGSRLQTNSTTGNKSTSASTSRQSYLPPPPPTTSSSAQNMIESVGQQQNRYLTHPVGYNPIASSNFNLAMLDLASGQDGMGADLGLGEYELHSKDMLGGGEFQGLGLSEFLQSLHENSFVDTNLNAFSLPPLLVSSHLSSLQQPPSLPPPPLESILRNHETTNGHDPSAMGILDGMTSHATISAALNPNGGGGGTASRDSNGISAPTSPLNKTERFLLTAADQKDGSRSDRLARVIHAKFEAGLLRPYNHVAGYTRLMRWMADNMTPTSRQRTLHTLSEFRPAFRAVASGLTDLDLVFIEEAFERLLLDYDRVFSSMGIPSCLWRRTGEIYKGNKEFADLVGVPIEQLRDGKLAIYELMAEESAVNYWEKYGNIAFDAGQKAVLTSCVLVNQTALSRKRKKSGAGGDRDREKEKARHREEAQINCCFSFTVRRDSYAIPSMIVGNFLRF